MIPTLLDGTELLLEIDDGRGSSHHFLREKKYGVAMLATLTTTQITENMNSHQRDFITMEILKNWSMASARRNKGHKWGRERKLIGGEEGGNRIGEAHLLALKRGASQELASRASVRELASREDRRD
jgi:hypothetical protein